MVWREPKIVIKLEKNPNQDEEFAQLQFLQLKREKKGWTTCRIHFSSIKEQKTKKKSGNDTALQMANVGVKNRSSKLTIISNAVGKLT